MRVIHYIDGPRSNAMIPLATSREMSGATEGGRGHEEDLLESSEARSPSRGWRPRKLPETEHVATEILSFGSGL
ncbi:hypothetical protein CO675_08210 [Bradyrhizobium sp. C9]|nr:hypothetical protein CO675_08210 [Bradyrhizobium sp. C9]GEC57319.1 hypothetical protein BEL01nite_63620 [Bradyrhizobium elkanii]